MALLAAPLGSTLLYNAMLALYFSHNYQEAPGSLWSHHQSHLGLTGHTSCPVAILFLCQASLPGVGLGKRSQGKERGEEGILAVVGGGVCEAFLHGVVSIPGERRVSCCCLGLHVQVVHVHA